MSLNDVQTFANLVDLWFNKEQKTCKTASTALAQLKEIGTKRFHVQYWEYDKRSGIVEEKRKKYHQDFVSNIEALTSIIQCLQ